jgi:hypothetical protein
VGLLIAHIDGEPSQSMEAMAIQNALQVAVSVWPVTFAAIVAQSLRTYATYKVERGIRLMVGLCCISFIWYELTNFNF